MAELDRAAISVRIAEARDKRAGLTQPELADILDVHWRTIQDWESPKNGTVPWDRLGEIADATGVTKEWLLHGEQQPEHDKLSQLLEAVNSLRLELGALDRKLDTLDPTPRLAAIESRLDEISRALTSRA